MSNRQFDEKTEFTAIAGFFQVNDKSRDSWIAMGILLAFYATVIAWWKIGLIAVFYVTGILATDYVARKGVAVSDGDLVTARKWRDRYIPLSVLCAMAWASLSFLTAVPGQPEYEFLGMLVLMFLAFANMSERSGDWKVFRIYHMTLTLVAGIGCFWQLLHDFTLLRTTVLLILFAGMNFIYGRARFLHEQQWDHIELAVDAQKAHDDVKQAYQKLEEIAITDGLTGLYNRRHIENLLGSEVERADRYQHSLTIMMLDVDHFKQVNDRYGHPVGDAVLQDVAKIIKAEIRNTDQAGRWGGEEFLVVCPATDLENTVILAERMRQAVESHDFPSVGQVTCSFGVATIQPDDRPEILLKRADQALYQAKHTGRNKISIDDAQPRRSASDRQ